MDKNDLKRKVKYVELNEVDVSTEEFPLIGTKSLATCVGLLVYDRSKKQALVSHLTVEWKTFFEDIINQLLLSKFISIEEYKKALGIFELYQEYFYVIGNAEEYLKKGLIDKKQLIINERSEESKLEFLIVPGYYKDNYRICEELLEYLTSLNSIFKKYQDSIPINAIHTSEKYTSKEFVFNPETGQFVSEIIENIPTNESNEIKKSI